MTELPISEIREPRQALRGAQRHDPKYAELRDSIREEGVQVPILVRWNEGEFEVVDGIQRLTLSRETGKVTIPARIVEADDRKALELQIIANLHRIDTTPVQYADQLRQMMGLDDGLTVPKLAVKLSKSPVWVHQTLGLLRLTPEIAAMVDSGKIRVANAWALSKLPPGAQPEYVAMAMSLPSEEFVPKVHEVARQLKEGNREYKSREYVHADHLQTLAAIKKAVDDAALRDALFAEAPGRVTPAMAFKLALEWVLHRDPISRRLSAAREKALRAKRDKELAVLDAEAARRRA